MSCDTNIGALQGHPTAGVGDVEQDVNRFCGTSKPPTTSASRGVVGAILWVPIMWFGNGEPASSGDGVQG